MHLIVSIICTIILSGSIVNLASAALTDGLVAHYEFENGDVADSSGNGNHGTAIVGLWIDDVEMGNSILLDGVDDYINLGNPLDIDQGFSFSGYFYLDADQSGKPTTVWNTFFLKSSYCENFGVMYEAEAEFFRVYEGPGCEGVRTVNYSLSLNEWFHFSITYDGALITLYIDGISIESFAHSGAIRDASPMILGAFLESSTYHWQGRMDDIRIYNRALSGAEVVEVGQKTSSPPSPTIVCSAPIEDISGASYTTGDHICITTESISPSNNVSVENNASLYLGSPEVELGSGFTVSSGASLSINTTADFKGLVSGIKQIILPAADSSNQINVLSGQVAETGDTAVIFEEWVTDTTHTFSLESAPAWLTIDPNTGRMTINASIVGTSLVMPFTVKVTAVNGSRTVEGSIAVSPIEIAETHIASGSTESVALAGVELNIPAGEFPAGMDIQVLQGTTEAGDRAFIIKSDGGVLTGKSFTLTFPQPAPAFTTNYLNGERSERFFAGQDDCDVNAPYPVPLSGEEKKRFFLFGDFRMGEDQQGSIEVGTDLWNAINELFLLTPYLGLYYADDLYFVERRGYVLCSKIPVDQIPIQAVNREPVLFFHGFTFAALSILDFGGGKDTSNNLLDVLYNTGWVLPFEFRWQTNTSFVDVARDLREVTKEVSSLTEKNVHLIAHSFGGLLARTYLQGLDYGRDVGHIPPVASLTTVGAPHSGIFSYNTGDGFPVGRDETITGYGIAACMQTSCWEAGDHIATDLSIYALISTLEEGGLPRALNSSNNRFPDDLPIQSLMGLRRLVGDSIARWKFDNPDPTNFTGGDGLLSFEGQRFRPSFGTTNNLLGSQADWGVLELITILGAKVREAVLGVDRADPNFEGDLVSLEFPGFGHTKAHRICDDGEGNPQDWWAIFDTAKCAPVNEQALEGEVYVRTSSHPLIGQLLYWFQEFSQTVDTPIINVIASIPNASESGAVGEITYQSSVAVTSNLTISYSLSGTATNGGDYTLAGGSATSITISAGSAQAVLEVHPVDDAVEEFGGETVIATLVDSAGYSLGGLATATVNISDNDSGPPPTATHPLNDTGITACSDSRQNGLACPVSGYPGQDAEYGRDVTHNDDSDGRAGFSFTKLDVAGNPLPPSATNWSCVKDNVTGLIWEVKTDDGGLHDRDDSYNWYNTNPASNGGNPGYADDDGDVCYGYDLGNPDTYCNTQAYTARVNQASWCGYNDWRISTREELRGLVDYTVLDSGPPSIDTDYFPNAVGPDVWSSSPNASNSDQAWTFEFAYSRAGAEAKSNNRYVRLVRGGQ